MCLDPTRQRGTGKGRYEAREDAGWTILEFSVHWKAVASTLTDRDPIGRFGTE